MKAKQRTIRNSSRKSGFFGGLFNRFLAGAVGGLGRVLARRSPAAWEKLVRKTSPVVSGAHLGVALDHPKTGLLEGRKLPPSVVAPTPLPSGDWVERGTFDPVSAQLVLPAWTREIVPFLANQLSEHTRRAYETDLKQFFRFLQDRVSLESIQGLRAEHVILFRKGLEEGRITGKPLEKSSVNRKLAVVKSFFQWLRANQVIRENPAALVKGFPQSQESSLQGLSDEEVRRILDQPNRGTRSGSLHNAVLHVLLFLGVRKGELIGLRMGDLTEERGVPVLKVRGKGHRVRILPVTATVRFAIENYFAAHRRDRSDATAPLFMPSKNPRTGNTEKALNPNAITYIVVRYARKAGIVKRVSPHSCRATCISNALDRKATHRSVQSLAGWSTPLMIQRYDKRRDDLKNSAAFLIDYADDEDPKKPK